MIWLAALSTPADACGGFFCNNTPVDQSGEDVVFSVDEEKNETTVHVQIAYSGSAEEFAWIVPVAALPEMLLSNDRMFRELSWRTAPTFSLDYVERGDCEGGFYPPSYGGYSDYSSSSSAAGADSGGTVTVITESTVGPYEMVVLQAQTSAGLLDWLQGSGYLLPDDLDPVLSPYVADGSYFVALRLRKDVDVGALQPIALKYAGTGASIPIQLTSIAATPDMRLHVYVVGEHRSVPDSYLHVKINDLVVDWFGYGQNYEDAITVAANEAGGQAFATDYAGDASVMDQVLWSEGRYDIPLLAASPSAYVFFDRLLSMGFQGDTQMLELFREFLPIPEGAGVDEQSFYNCLACYTEIVDTIPFDAAAFAAAIDERVVAPLHEAQLMFDDNPVLTRMTSSVSPAEMTVDPTFVFNADMEQTVSADRRAQVELFCATGGSFYDSPRKLTLADGRSYDLPSSQWLADAGMTEYQYLASLMGVYALTIEDTSGSGQPTVLFDYTEQARAEAEAFNADQPSDDLDTHAACGCSTSTSGAASGVVLLGLAGLAARRRRLA
ncbi:MAG: DUF2330 domain-containing protein [Myxococcota bacterium]